MIPYQRGPAIGITLVLFLVQPALAQNQVSASNRPSFSDFVAGFEAVALPVAVDPPVVDIESYPFVTDQRHVEEFLVPHGLGLHTEARAGYVLYADAAFVALSVLIALGEERAWYLLTFTQDGKAVDKARVAAFYQGAGSRHEHWSECTESLQIRHTSLYRFYDQEGNEVTCTQSQWQAQIQQDGRIDISEEVAQDCSR